MRALQVFFLSVVALLGTSLGAAPTAPVNILRSDGIGSVLNIVKFGTVEAVALRSLSGLLGKLLRQRTITDCGQGEAMVEIMFQDNLILTFFHGNFSGWSLNDKTVYRTDKGISIGSPRSAVMKAYPGTTVDDGPLGVTFGSEAGVNGFLDANRPRAHVTGLYAGETCMVS